MHSLTQLDSWQQLEKHSAAHFHEYKSNKLKNINASPDDFRISCKNVILDYSQQCIDEKALSLLFQLADECRLGKKIRDLINGYPVNRNEKKPALHTALRSEGDEEIFVNNHNIIPDILEARQSMRYISTQIREGEWRGSTGKAMTDIVNIGIGGSLLGPQFCISALTEFTTDKLRFHFIAGIDPNEFKRVVTKLDPETTLFIVASKSFATKETLYNMNKAIKWLGQTAQLNKHIIAVTANTGKTKEFGINNVIPMWEWVGGRYSACSSINLITCIAIGFENFSAILSGANAMDKHFTEADFDQNLPVLLALLGIWNNNFLKIHNLLVLTYSQDLQQFVPYLQQLDMESNGKSIDMNGQPVNYATGPIVWGGLANLGQHSYFQLLCEGTHKIAADLISFNMLHDDIINQMCDAHQKILSTHNEVNNQAYVYQPVKTPTNHISLIGCTPKSIGSIMALYEHKIFTQSVIWNINAFDQPGVELSKQIIG